MRKTALNPMDNFKLSEQATLLLCCWGSIRPNLNACGNHVWVLSRNNLVILMALKK